VAVRYMGTKRHMAGHVRSAIESMEPRGCVVDLFSGMGSVTESLQNLFPVVTNDALSFTAAISRSRFTGATRDEAIESVLRRLRPAYLERLTELSIRFARQLEEEQAVLSSGREALAAYMSRARHVGNDRCIALSAKQASNEITHHRYCLASLYFSAGYFSLAQTIEIDALRYAIDSIDQPAENDWLLGAWLVGIASLVNAPGHTAQFLKPNTPSIHARIVRGWRRSVWTQFESGLGALRQIGSPSWRSQNRALVGDALDLVGSSLLNDVGAFYADPPYTKDQYSRFYHVYETLYRYDFPDSTGIGRTRSDRFSTGFSLKSSVVASFHDLCRNVARKNVPLILSYPDQGLLDDAGWGLQDIASAFFSDIQVITIDAHHSTMGASKGSPQKPATEHVYVCRP